MVTMTIYMIGNSDDDDDDNDDNDNDDDNNNDDNNSNILTVDNPRGSSSCPLFQGHVSILVIQEREINPPY